MTLVNRGTCIKHTFWQRLAASQEEQMSLLTISAFLDERKYKNLGS